MFSRFDIGNRMFAAVASLAISAVMMATVIDYATPLSGVVA